MVCFRTLTYKGKLFDFLHYVQTLGGDADLVYVQKQNVKDISKGFFLLTNGPKCFNGILQEYQVVFSLSSKEQKKS